MKSISVSTTSDNYKTNVLTVAQWDSGIYCTVVMYILLLLQTCAHYLILMETALDKDFPFLLIMFCRIKTTKPIRNRNFLV